MRKISIVGIVLLIICATSFSTYIIGYGRGMDLGVIYGTVTANAIYNAAIVDFVGKIEHDGLIYNAEYNSLAKIIMRINGVHLDRYMSKPLKEKGKKFKGNRRISQWDEGIVTEGDSVGKGYLPLQ